MDRGIQQHNCNFRLVYERKPVLKHERRSIGNALGLRSQRMVPCEVTHVVRTKVTEELHSNNSKRSQENRIMRKYIEFRTTFCCCLVLLLACLTTSLPSLGQNPGNNVVQGSGVTTSTAYIDASVIAGTSGAGDICALINAALGLIGTAGGSGTRGYGTSTVIDARGIP